MSEQTGIVGNIFANIPECMRHELFEKILKTETIKIERIVRHPLYGRVIRKKSKLMAHDETNDARIGDFVEVMETRPLSKSKRWRLTKVLERAK